MIPTCDVPTYSGEGTHEIGDSERLCLKHATKWDKEESDRIGRLYDLQFELPEATDEEVWAENYSRWCGEQK